MSLTLYVYKFCEFPQVDAVGDTVAHGIFYIQYKKINWFLKHAVRLFDISNNNYIQAWSPCYC
jgi:hypothetical protein